MRSSLLSFNLVSTDLWDQICILPVWLVLSSSGHLSFTLSAHSFVFALPGLDTLVLLIISTIIWQLLRIPYLRAFSIDHMKLVLSHVIIFVLTFVLFLSAMLACSFVSSQSVGGSVNYIIASKIPIHLVFVQVTWRILLDMFACVKGVFGWKDFGWENRKNFSFPLVGRDRKRELMFGHNYHTFLSQSITSIAAFRFFSFAISHRYFLSG